MTSKVISQSMPIPVESPGVADVVGFGLDGVVVVRNQFNIQPTNVIKNFSFNAGGWRVERHVRLVADTTGNKNADIVGFGENGVWISRNNGNGTFQDPPQMVIEDYSIQKGGWFVDKHLRFMADIRKTGRADIVGFGDSGVYVSQNNGNNNFSRASLAVADFGHVGGGWKLDRHVRFLADVTGDGYPDIVGFGEQNVLIGYNNKNGTFEKGAPVIHDFCIGAGGWQVDKHPRFVADLTGDGKADVLGFGDAGVYVSLNDNNGRSFRPPKLVVQDFGYVQGGWRVEKHPRCLADLTGNGRADIVGFGDAGVYIAINKGDGTFEAPKLAINNFGYNAGWRVEKHPRFAVDLTGDGCADIIGFGENFVYVSYNDGRGNFGPFQQLTNALAFNGGQWAEDKTVRWLANLRQW